MMTNLLAPKVDLAALIIRLGLAAIFIVHGYFKVYQDNPLLEQMDMSTQLAVGWAEIICGLALAGGLLSRPAALVMIVVQVAAIVLVTGSRALSGPAIQATGADYTKVGPEFNLALIAMCVGVILLGSGSVSVDHFLMRLWQRRKVAAPMSATAEVGAH